MQDKFIKYYWPFFKGFGPIFLFLFIIDFAQSEGLSVDIQKLLDLCFVLILLSLFIGGIFHSFYELYRPWRRKRIFQNSLIRKVKIEGFKQDIENNCLEGCFNGYYVTLHPNSDLEKGDTIAINVFVDLRKSEVNDVLEKIREYDLIQSDGFYWFTASVPLTLTGSIPTDKIIEKLEDMTTKLNQYKVQPFLPEN